MRGNFHAQFLEGWTGAIPSGYSVKPHESPYSAKNAHSRAKSFVFRSAVITTQVLLAGAVRALEFGEEGARYTGEI